MIFDFMFFVFVHMIADFLLINDYIDRLKSHCIYMRVVRCYIWAMSVSIAMIWLGYMSNVMEIILLFMVRYMIDLFDDMLVVEQNNYVMKIYIPQLICIFFIFLIMFLQTL